MPAFWIMSEYKHEFKSSKMLFSKRISYGFLDVTLCKRLPSFPQIARKLSILQIDPSIRVFFGFFSGKWSAYADRILSARIKAHFRGKNSLSLKSYIPTSERETLKQPQNTRRMDIVFLKSSKQQTPVRNLILLLPVWVALAIHCPL